MCGWCLIHPTPINLTSVRVNGHEKQKCHRDILIINSVSWKFRQSEDESPRHDAQPVSMSLFLMCCCICVCVNLLVIPPTPWHPHTHSRDRQPWNDTVFILHTSLPEFKQFEQQILSVFMDSALIYSLMNANEKYLYVTALLYNVWRKCYSSMQAAAESFSNEWNHTENSYFSFHPSTGCICCIFVYQTLLLMWVMWFMLVSRGTLHPTFTKAAAPQVTLICANLAEYLKLVNSFSSFRPTNYFREF